MKRRLLKYASLSVLVVLAGTTIYGCKKKTKEADPEVVNNYSTMLMVGSWPNTAYYISEFPSLTEGEINLKGNGAEITGKVYAQDVFQRNGYYYHANFTAGRLGKYHVENGVLITDQEVPFTHLRWASYTWIDDETVVLIGTNGDGNEARYSIVKVNGMQMTNGVLNLESIPTDFDAYNIGFAEYRDNKIFLGYGFGSTDWTNYPVMEVYTKTLVAAISYPSMSITETSEDTRTSGGGGSNVYAPFSLVDENKDIYFITDPVYDYDYVSPSVIFRIPSGSDEVDPNYFFDFSAEVENGMAASIWYIGSGKAIIRSRVAGQSVDGDHFFSIVNLHTGAFIKKLDLPADKGERMVQAVVVENGKAYIAVNADDKDYIWEYDPATDTLKKGVEIVGGVDYILRLEKLR